MCLIAFSWQPQLGRLQLLANRDEFYARPAAAADWWPDAPDIWAGRDLDAGGTWLGVNRFGRFAALTNVREAPMRQGLRSRGELVTNFLTSTLNAQAYLEQVLSQGEDYAGFNLLLGDMAPAELWYGGNRVGAKQKHLNAGTYGLSNALLDTPWPKVTRLKAGLATLDDNDADRAFALLDNSTQAAPECLPDTGVSTELELLLSSAFIHSAEYGTRAQTYLSITGQQLDITERSRGAQAELLSTQHLQLMLPLANKKSNKNSNHGAKESITCSSIRQSDV